MKQSTPSSEACAMSSNAMPTTIGLDLGDRHAHFCVLDGSTGQQLEEGRITMARGGLKLFFDRLVPARVVMEVGTHSAWVSRLAQSSGLEVIVANARKVELITRNERKNDRTDAELLARLGRVDPALLAPVRHRSVQYQCDLAVHRARTAAVASRTALINHVRGQFKSLGYRVKLCSAECFHLRVLECMPKELEAALSPILRMIEHTTIQIKGFDALIEQMANERYPETKLLRQVPGVGPLISLCYVLTLEDPARIKHSRQVGPYLGLVPRRHDSGKSSPQLRITKAGDQDLRRLLVISANYILGRFGPDSDLRRFGMKIAGAGGKNARKRAKTAVARRLAV